MTQPMQPVVAYEFRMNNSQQFTVAKLKCGHERVFEYDYRPEEALCWVCETTVPARKSIASRRKERTMTQSDLENTIDKLGQTVQKAMTELDRLRAQNQALRDALTRVLLRFKRLAANFAGEIDPADEDRIAAAEAALEQKGE